MTTYNVHIYREMRLVFGGIEAASPEEAAAIARDKLTEDADDFDDCDGETFCALVDVQGDEQHEQSRFIDFEPEQLRLAAPKLLEACHMVIDCWGHGDFAGSGMDLCRRRRRSASHVCPASEPATTDTNRRDYPDHARSRIEALFRAAALPRLGQRQRHRNLLHFRRGPEPERCRRRGAAAGGDDQRMDCRRPGRLRPATGDRRAQLRQPRLMPPPPQSDVMPSDTTQISRSQPAPESQPKPRPVTTKVSRLTPRRHETEAD